MLPAAGMVQGTHASDSMGPRPGSDSDLRPSPSPNSRSCDSDVMQVRRMRLIFIMVPSGGDELAAEKQPVIPADPSPIMWANVAGVVSSPHSACAVVGAARRTPRRTPRIVDGTCRRWLGPSTDRTTGEPPLPRAIRRFGRMAGWPRRLLRTPEENLHLVRAADPRPTVTKQAERRSEVTAKGPWRGKQRRGQRHYCRQGLWFYPSRQKGPLLMGAVSNAVLEYATLEKLK
jgi:hypothetical protein